MKKTSKFNFKTSLLLLLSLLLCLTVGLSAACSDGSDSSSLSSTTSETEEETYPTDYQSITNGDFEFSTFTKTEFPVSSGIGWSLSRDSITTSAPATDGVSSGIIDTSKFDEATAKKLGLEIADNPGTPESKELIGADELASYENVKENGNDDKLPMSGSKILVISNKTKTPGQGTAQKFSSTATLTLERHQYARLSVWVNTHGLKSKAQGVDFGAYIAVQNTVASNTVPFVIKNINTADQWVKYTIYLEGSDFAASKFKVVLGLGFGSSKIVSELVEGYAFFDNVHYEVMDKNDGEEGEKGWDSCANAVANEDTYSLYSQDQSANTYSINENLEASEAGQTFAQNNATEGDKFTERLFKLSHARKATTANDFTVEGGTAKVNSFNPASQTTAASDLVTVDDNLSTDYTAPYEGARAQTIHFKFTEEATSASYTTPAIEVAGKKYLKLSFWVKVDTEHDTDKALTITVNDLGTGSVEAIDTVIATSVVTEEDENENFNGWREYIVCVANTVTDAKRSFTLTFDFGITEKSEYTDGDWSLTKGYALITAFNTWELTEKDYNGVDTSYSYAKKVSLTADLPKGAEDKEEEKGANDSYGFKYGATDNVTIESNVASNVMNYTGVVGGSKAVSGTNKNAYTHAGITSGVINTKYLDSYSFLDTTEKTAIGALEKGEENEYLQPLMIKGNGTVSYGYYGPAATLAANTTTYITVDVKVVGENAVAYIYLANSNALDGFEVLAMNAGEGENKINNQFVVSVKATDCTNGWFTVRMLITTGNKDIAYRPEFWIGARSATEATAEANGLVLFDNYTVDSKTVSTLKTELAIEYPNDTVTETKYTQENTTVKVTVTDEEGNTSVKEETVTHKPTVVFEQYTKSKAIIANYSTVHVDNVIDNTVNEDVETDEDHDHDHDHDHESESAEGENANSFSWALQITSIILVVVLITLLIIVLVRTTLKNRGSKRKIKASYYSANSREAAAMKAEERKARRALKEAEEQAEAEAQPEEVTPYDYDNPENNIVEEAEEEVVEETPTEEAPAEEANDEEQPK